MKTIKRNNEILRVMDNEAEKLVKNEGYKFCPKKEWKVIRDAAKIAAKKRADAQAEVKTDKKKKSKPVA